MCVQRLPLREVVLAILASILPQAKNWEVVGRLCLCSDVPVGVCMWDANVSLMTVKHGGKVVSINSQHFIAFIVYNCERKQRSFFKCVCF